MNTKIKEENLPQLITSSLEKHHDWSKVFHELYSEMKKQIKADQYSSIGSNFGAIFTYELIKRKTDIVEFKEVFREILTTLNTKEIENLYTRFLHEDSSESLSSYIKNDRFNNDFSSWTNMGFIFHNLEKKNDETYLVFEPSTFDYLKEMLLAVDESNVLAVYGAGINRFIYGMCYRVHTLEPIIEVVRQNPVYTIEKPGYNHNFLNTILNNVANHSYELSKEENLANFAQLESSIKNFKELYSEALINQKDSANNPQEKMKVHLSILHFLNEVGVDTCEIIHNKFLEKFHNTKPDPKHASAPPELQEYFKNAPYRNLINEISASISVGLGKKTPFNLNLNHEASAIENYVMLKYLEINIQKGAQIELTDEDIQYLEKECKFQKEKDPILGLLDIDFDSLSTYTEYCKIHNSLPQKDISSKSKKL